MNNKYRVLLSNTLVFAIGNILVKIISFLLMPLYTSALTTEQYGVAELLNSLTEIVLPLATLCIIEALYRFSIDDDADYQKLFTNSLVVVFSGNVLVIIFCLIWFYVFGYQYALHFCLLYVTASFYKLTTQFARGLGYVRRYVLYGILNSLILIFSNIILLVVFEGSIEAYLLSFSIGYGVSGLLALITSREDKYFDLSKTSYKCIKELLKYSLPSVPNMLSWWINSISGRYIVLFYLGSNIAGLYTAASKLPAMVNLVTSIFQQAWQYSTATEINKEDNKEFFTNVFRVYTYLCVVVCAALIVLNRGICFILLQEDFYVAWRYVPFLLLAATFGCIGTYFGTFYNAIKNNKMLMISTLIGAMINLILNFVLIPRYGGIGAAIATAICYLVILVIRVLDIRQKIDLDINYNRFLLQFILLVLLVVLGCYEGAVIIICSLLLFTIICCSDIGLIKKGKKAVSLLILRIKERKMKNA